MVDQSTVAETKQGAPWTVLLTSTAYFMVTLDALVVVTALPAIRADLGGGAGELHWSVNAYNLAFAAGIVPAATLGDRLGRRRVYSTGLALFTAASAACALAPGIEQLITFRAVQGVGAAIITPLGLTLITQVFPPERRGSVVGIWGGIAGLGVATGPLVGGAVSQGIDWHWVFWLNLPIGIAALVGCRRLLTESHGPSGRLDLVGMVLATAGAAAVIWGLVRGPAHGWYEPATAAAVVIGLSLLAAFLAWEARVAEPMVPLSLFRWGAFTAAAVSSLLMSAAIFSAAYLTSQYFQLGRGNDPLSTGLRFLPWTATPLVIAPLAGRLFDRFGARRLAVPGLALQAAGFVWISHLAGTGAGYASFLAPFMIAGVGVSLALPTLPTAGINAVPPTSIGRASGVLNSLQRLGTAIGIAVVTVVFDSHGSLADPVSTTQGYRAAIIAAAGLSALGALTAIGVRSARSAESSRPM